MAQQIDGGDATLARAREDAAAKSEYVYSAFISYRHIEPDRRWARWLHAALETYRVPGALQRERGLSPRIGRVFRDEEELAASADLSQSIEQALRDSRFLVVICSPRTPASRWVNREIEVFRELGRGGQILALLVEGEPEESFPPALREVRQIVIDASGVSHEQVEAVEPLAADVRRARRGGHAAKFARLRLVSAILGVNFDDLRQREQERRMRRIAGMALAAAVVALVMASLAIVAGVQWKAASNARAIAEKREREAIEQREAAAAARSLAEKRQQEAVAQRDLTLATVNTLVFSVHDSMDRPGLLDLRQSILNLAAAPLQKLESTSIGDIAQHSDGALHYKLGSLLLITGHTADARAAFANAITLLGKAAAEDPKDRAAQQNLAGACDAAADAAWNEGDLKAAHANYEQAAAVAGQLVQSAPGDPASRNLQAAVLNKLGRMALSDGNLADARTRLLHVLELRQALVKESPKDATFRRGLSITHNELASVYQRAGELKEAQGHCLEALHLVEESAAADPNNIDLRRDLSICQSRLGDVARAANDLPTAQSAYDKGLELDKAMTAADPTNIQARKDLAISYQKVGDVHLLMSDLPGASAAFHSGAELAESVAAADPADADSKRVLSIFYERLSGLPTDPPDLQAARDFGRKCLVIREALATSQPDNATAAFDLIAIQTHLGELDRLDHRYDDALAWYDRALSKMHDLQKAGKLEGQPDRLKWITLLEGQEALCRQAQTRPATPATTQSSP